jgi:alkylation response protein AidB-like acyl-CoA dehydrogenase
MPALAGLRTQGASVDFEIPEDAAMMKETIRRFVQKELHPIGLKVEQEDRIPEGIVQTMRELGLFGLGIPRSTAGWAWGCWANAWSMRSWPRPMPASAI